MSQFLLTARPCAFKRGGIMSSRSVKKKTVNVDPPEKASKEPNAESLEALAEIDDDKKLTRYANAADMFKKLGIKVGKA
jgi:hypothetical protein